MATEARCPTCGGSVHANEAIGDYDLDPKGARKHLDRAWDEAGEAQDELDSLAAHLRAVVENCRHTTDMAAIRHQLVGLLPEVQPMEPEDAAKMREKGMGHIVDRHEQLVHEAWASYGYGEGT